MMEGERLPRDDNDLMTTEQVAAEIEELLKGRGYTLIPVAVGNETGAICDMRDFWKCTTHHPSFMLAKLPQNADKKSES